MRKNILHSKVNTCFFKVFLYDECYDKVIETLDNLFGRLENIERNSMIWLKMKKLTINLKFQFQVSMKASLNIKSPHAKGTSARIQSNIHKIKLHRKCASSVELAMILLLVL